MSARVHESPSALYPMNGAKRIFTALFVTLAIAILTPRPAGAHGGGAGLDYDPCAQKLGDDYVHMAVYQPSINPYSEYCSSVPQGGKTLIVVDFVGPRFVAHPMSVVIHREGGDPVAQLVSSVPRSGVVNLWADLKPGAYEADVVVSDGAHLHELSFPISVSSRWGRFRGFGVAIALTLLVVAIAVVYEVDALRSERRSEPNNRRKNWGEPRLRNRGRSGP